MSSSAKGTALITGASSGIGAAFARQLAAQGYDLILVARRLDRLQSLGNELHERFSVCAEAIPADLTSPDDLERVEACAAGRDDLTLLINNAGFGVGGAFLQVPLERNMDMIQVHVVAATRLCHAALPGMVRRKHGGIINVSSIGAIIPVSASVCYGATKAYLNAFSEALQSSLKGTGVHVQALCPGFTHTEFHDTEAYKTGLNKAPSVPKFAWMTADDVVTTSLRALERGPVICVPGWVNRLMVMMARSALAPLVAKAAAGRAATEN